MAKSNDQIRQLKSDLDLVAQAAAAAKTQIESYQAALSSGKLNPKEAANMSSVLQGQIAEVAKLSQA